MTSESKAHYTVSKWFRIYLLEGYMKEDHMLVQYDLKQSYRSLFNLPWFPPTPFDLEDFDVQLSV